MKVEYHREPSFWYIYIKIGKRYFRLGSNGIITGTFYK